MQPLDQSPPAAAGFVITVDGARLTARPGQTIAAVLLAAGQRATRRTRIGGRPRGVFCGIGMCFDCLVVCNGEPGVRACLRPVAPDDVIETDAERSPGDVVEPDADRLSGGVVSPDAGPFRTGERA
ncbi:(2Fe-2S)-binding protein [Micromonospora sp. NPDC050397]|uniref:(2Fe-2S)-binding protein n=1 Tax=Micromonospora sp. NPDC050397 TaxID=3364279 RepID=UPI003850BA87